MKTRVATLVVLCSLALLSLGATVRHMPDRGAHWKGWFAWATRLSALVARTGPQVAPPNSHLALQWRNGGWELTVRKTPHCRHLSG